MIRHQPDSFSQKRAYGANPNLCSPRKHKHHDDKIRVYRAGVRKSFITSSHQLRERLKTVASISSTTDVVWPMSDFGGDDDDWEDIPAVMEASMLNTVLKPILSKEKGGRRQKFAEAWNLQMESLVAAYLSQNLLCSCEDRQESSISRKILCITLTSISFRTFQTCLCSHWPANLIAQGLFPCAPTNPRTAFGTDVLELFYNVYTEGPISKRGFAEGLRRFHQTRQSQEFSEFRKHFYNAWTYWNEVRERAKVQWSQWVFQHTSERTGNNELENLCPSCFFHEKVPLVDNEMSDKRPAVFIGLDGNFQHRRLRHGHGSAQSHEELSTSMFIAPTAAVEHSTEPPLELDTSPCSHHFSAPDKPKSFEMYDDTGLLATVCRHGIPLRYLSIHQGERFIDVAHLLCSVMNEMPSNQVFHVTYDIGCRLEPYFRTHHPNFHNRMVFMINAFHAYAHEMKCQVQFGPKYTEGGGETDGEGPERHWSALAPLVSAGRVSSAPRRRQAIHIVGQSFAQKLRESLPRLLKVRFLRALDHLNTATEGLSNLQNGLRKNDTTGNMEPFPENERGVVYNPYTNHAEQLNVEFLDQQVLLQKRFFRTIPGRVEIKTHGSIRRLISLVSKEQFEAEKLNFPLQWYLSLANDNAEKESVTAAWNQSSHQIRIIPMIENLSQELRKYGFSRQDLKVGGKLWAESMIPVEKQICDALQREQDCLNRLHAFHSSGNHQQAISQTENNLQNIRRKTDQLLLHHGYSRNEWSLESPLFLSYQKNKQLQVVDSAYQNVLHCIASRALELRAIHSRVHGQKDSAKLLQSVKRKYPQIEKAIHTFNNAVSNCPPELHSLRNFSTLRATDFYNSLSNDYEQSGLICGFEYNYWLQHGTPNVEALWPVSENVRLGIALRLKQLRAREEIQLLQAEAQALRAWVLRQLHVCRMVLGQRDIRQFSWAVADFFLSIRRCVHGLCQLPESLLSDLDRNHIHEILLLVNNSFCSVFKQNDAEGPRRDYLEHTSIGLEKIESLDDVEMESISDVEGWESLFHEIDLISQEIVEETPETSHLEDSCSVTGTDP